MGSRYDIAVLRGTSLADFAQAASNAGSIGPAVERPWTGDSGITVAQIDTSAGSNVVVVGPPMRMPRGIDTSLANRLAAEWLFATVWDSVSTYCLHIVGDGVDRAIDEEPSDEEDGEPILAISGDRLPEEPDWPPLDEAYIQVVFERRCGIDPGRLLGRDATWYEFAPAPR